MRLTDLVMLRFSQRTLASAPAVRAGGQRGGKDEGKAMGIGADGVDQHGAAGDIAAHHAKRALPKACLR